MATLASLKLSGAVKPTHVPAVQLRRNKLANKLHEQIELCEAQRAGAIYAPKRLRTITNKHTNNNKNIFKFKF